MPPTNGNPGSTPMARAIGMCSPRSVHLARMMPRCWGGGMRQARVSRPAIIIRLTDQLVHVPSGVLAMLMP